MLFDSLYSVQKKLYLDDIRPIPFGFVGVCSYLEFVTFIEQNGLPNFISFDHDLEKKKRVMIVLKCWLNIVWTDK